MTPLPPHFLHPQPPTGQHGRRAAQCHCDRHYEGKSTTSDCRLGSAAVRRSHALSVPYFSCPVCHVRATTSPFWTSTPSLPPTAARITPPVTGAVSSHAATTITLRARVSRAMRLQPPFASSFLEPRLVVFFFFCFCVNNLDSDTALRGACCCGAKSGALLRPAILAGSSLFLCIGCFFLFFFGLAPPRLSETHSRPKLFPKNYTTGVCTAALATCLRRNDHFILFALFHPLEGPLAAHKCRFQHVAAWPATD